MIVFEAVGVGVGEAGFGAEGEFLEIGEGVFVGIECGIGGIGIAEAVVFLPVAWEAVGIGVGHTGGVDFEGERVEGDAGVGVRGVGAFDLQDVCTRDEGGSGGFDDEGSGVGEGLGAEEGAIEADGEGVGAEAFAAGKPAANHVGDEADAGGGEGLGRGEMEAEAGGGGAGGEVFFEVGDGFVGGDGADGAGIGAGEIVVVITGGGATGGGDGTVDFVAEFVGVIVDGAEGPDEVEGDGLSGCAEEEQEAGEEGLRSGVATRHLVIVVVLTRKRNLLENCLGDGQRIRG